MPPYCMVYLISASTIDVNDLNLIILLIPVFLLASRLNLSSIFTADKSAFEGGICTASVFVPLTVAS